MNDAAGPGRSLPPPPVPARRPPTSTRPLRRQRHPRGRRIWELPSLLCRPRSSPSPLSRSALRATWAGPACRRGRGSSTWDADAAAPGLWLAQEAGVSLVGVDFSPVAVDTGHAPGRAVWAGRPGTLRRRRSHAYRASGGQRRRRRLHRRVPFRRRPGRSRRRGTPDPSARTAAGPDQLAAEDPRRCPVAGQSPHPLAATATQCGLHRHHDAGPARLARPVDPRLPGRPRPRRSRRRRPARRPAR